MTFTIKSWIYEEIQSRAFCNSKTIVWDKQYDYDENGNEVAIYNIGVEDIVKETEKAVFVNCRYWSTRSYRPNFTVYNGYRVWIPKSAILKIA